MQIYISIFMKTTEHLKPAIEQERQSVDASTTAAGVDHDVFLYIRKLFYWSRNYYNVVPSINLSIIESTILNFLMATHLSPEKIKEFMLLLNMGTKMYIAYIIDLESSLPYQ